jgi:glyceraldehyde 3-phosphate dehydrogenase
MDTPLRVAINGFGRIGRLVFRMGFGDRDLEIVAINDLGDPANLVYLLQHDSVYRRYDRAVSLDRTPKQIGTATAPVSLVSDSTTIPFFQEKDPLNLPWKDLAVDVVVESTGAFESFEKAAVHIAAGAKRVLLSAPAKDEDGDQGRTVLMGINDADLKLCTVSSNGSCTTNSAHPVMQILNESLGIKKAMLSTVHAYTATQSLVDGPVKGTDYRRGRAGAGNITPSTTGAAVAVTRALKELAGKFDGVAFRVPVIDGSVSEITFVAARPTTTDEVNTILRNAAESPRWAKFLKVTDEQLVSSDIIGEPYGAIVDTSLTKVVDGDLVMVVSWYDNEMGYTKNLVEHLRVIKEIL